MASSLQAFICPEAYKLSVYPGFFQPQNQQYDQSSCMQQTPVCQRIKWFPEADDTRRVMQTLGSEKAGIE